MKKIFSLFQKNSEKLFTLAVSILLAVGVLFRARHFFAGRSLWLDEAMLALDILDLSFWELTQQPLPYQQGAPIGFLFFVKAITLLLGNSEYAFRLYSFGASILSLLLLAFLAKHYLKRVGTLFTLALFASSPFIIYYSAETKQYGSDVTVVLLLLFLLHKHLEGSFSARKNFVFIFTNIFLLWCSHPALFIVAAIGAVLLFHYWREKSKKGISFALLNLALSGISATLLYWFHLQPLSSSNFLRSFWEEVFMPLPPTLSWFGGAWEGVLRNPFGIDNFYFGYFLFFVAGIFFLWRRNWQFALSLLLTLLATFTAGALQKYPLAERMMLFSAPIFFLLFGAGLDALYEQIRNKKLAFLVMLFLSAYMLFTPFKTSFKRLKKPLYREHIRPSLTYLKDNLRESDQVYVYYFAEPAFSFYLRKYDFGDINYFVGGKHQENPEMYLEELNELDSRVWFLFTHVFENASINEEDFIIDYLDENADRKREYRAPGTSVSLYLYEFP